MTHLGPLDALGSIEGGLDYDALLPDSIEIELSGHRVRVLSLETLVRLKRSSSDPKDRQKLPVLEEALRRLQSG